MIPYNVLLCSDQPNIITCLTDPQWNKDIIIADINRFGYSIFGRKDMGIATSWAFLGWFKLLFRTLSNIYDGVF